MSSLKMLREALQATHAYAQQIPDEHFHETQGDFIHHEFDIEEYEPNSGEDTTEYDSDTVRSSEDGMEDRDELQDSMGDVLCDTDPDLPSTPGLSYDLDNDEELYCAYNELGFQYGASPLFETDELLQILLYKIRIDGNVSLAVHQHYCDIINCLKGSNVTPDRRTIERMLDMQTDVLQNRFDACQSGCCAFTGILMDQTRCSECQKPRVMGDGKRSSFDYIEFIHRLRLWYSEPLRALQLKEYRKKCQAASADGSMRDIWDGKLVKELNTMGMLMAERDLAFTFSTDGVQLFRKGKPHTIWPLMLTCINLPPEVRFLRENILFLGNLYSGRVIESGLTIL